MEIVSGTKLKIGSGTKLKIKMIAQQKLAVQCLPALVVDKDFSDYEGKLLLYNLLINFEVFGTGTVTVICIV